jgi:hypothetical protein
LPRFDLRTDGFKETDDSGHSRLKEVETAGDVALRIELLLGLYFLGGMGLAWGVGDYSLLAFHGLFSTGFGLVAITPSQKTPSGGAW